MNNLNKMVKDAESRIKEMNKTDEVKNYVKILEEFIRKKRVIGYGGTAINNILPKHLQFYDENDISDYDMYSMTPMEHAIELANHYYDLGFKDTTASAGMHPGTFKVFVNFVPIADFTFLSPKLFMKLEAESLIVDGIAYCSPNFLRMNFMEELSHPLNVPDRFEKVFLRFQLMNLVYPMILPRSCEEKVFRRPVFARRHQLFAKTLNAMLEQNVVFIGEFAYYRFFKNMHDYIPHEFDAICENPHDVAIFIRNKLAQVVEEKDISVSRVRVMEGEEKFTNIEICIDNHRWVTLWLVPSAISYNELPVHIDAEGANKQDVEIMFNRSIRIASPETMMLYLYYFYYLERELSLKNKGVLCIIKDMMNMYFSMEDKGVWKHFSLLCYGKPANLRDLKILKSNKYRELKKNTESMEYKWLFLKYEPAEKDHMLLIDNAENLEKQKPRDKRRKTRVNRENNRVIRNKRFSVRRRRGV